MKTSPALLATALFLLSAAPGCSKKDKESDKNSAPQPPATEILASPTEGGKAPAALTIALIRTATNMAETGADWSEAVSQVEKRLGKVTTVHGMDHRWAAREGDHCAYISLEMLSTETGTMVGAVQGPVALSKDDAEADWNRCLDSVGAQGMAVEDQEAPAPPAAGGATTIADLFAGVQGKRSEWVGAEVSIKAFYLSTSTAFVEDVKTTTLSLSATKGETRGSIGCTFATGELVPKLEPWDEVRVSGTVHASFGGGLQACRLQL